MSMLAAPKEGVYQLLLRARSAWVRRKYRDQFDRVQRFCLFIGYPRSGHSIVGALLNAHKDAVISHELIIAPLILAGCARDDLYARIIARAQWFNMRGNQANYDYQIPRQWQGRFESLKVIGDKRGGTVSEYLIEHPDLLQRLRDLTSVPLKLVHVVRNPFDNIAAISIWHHLGLQESIEFYFHHFQATAMLDSPPQSGEVITLRHEQMIRDPRQTLSDLCAFLGLEIYPGYLDDCASVVFQKPTFTRQKVEWTDALVRDVQRRSAAYGFLRGYQFEITEEQRGG